MISKVLHSDGTPLEVNKEVWGSKPLFNISTILM